MTRGRTFMAGIGVGLVVMVTLIHMLGMGSGIKEPANNIKNLNSQHADRYMAFTLASGTPAKRNETITDANVTVKSLWHSDKRLYNTLKLPKKDICDSSTILLLMVITTPSSFKHRTIYRETVLSPIISGCLKEIKYTFVVGKTGVAETESKLEEEQEMYGDILQGNFTDSYENLTLKSLFMLQSAHKLCPQAKYTHKLDDDVFAVEEEILNYLQADTFVPYSIFGSIFDGTLVIHDTKNKWHAKNFNETYYPRYVSGTSYIISQPLLEPLFNAAISLPFVRIEDAFVTGVAARETKLPVKHYEVPGFSYAFSKSNLPKVNFSSTKTIHGLKSKQIQYLHEKLRKDHELRC